MIGEKFTLLQYSVSGILGLIETEQFVIPKFNDLLCGKEVKFVI